MKKISLSALSIVLATTAYAAPSRDTYMELTTACAPFLTIATLDQGHITQEIKGKTTTITKEPPFSTLSAEEMQHAIDACKPTFQSSINAYYKDFPTSAGHLNAGFQAAQSMYAAQLTKEAADLARMTQEQSTKTTQATTESVLAANAKMREAKAAETASFVTQMNDNLKTAQAEATAKAQALGAAFATLQGMHQAHAGVGDVQGIAGGVGNQQLELGFGGGDL